MRRDYPIRSLPLLVLLISLAFPAPALTAPAGSPPAAEDAGIGATEPPIVEETDLPIYTVLPGDLLEVIYNLEYGITDGPVYVDQDHADSVLLQLDVEGFERAAQWFDDDRFKAAAERAGSVRRDIYLATPK